MTDLSKCLFYTIAKRYTDFKLYSIKICLFFIDETKQYSITHRIPKEFQRRLFIKRATDSSANIISIAISRKLSLSSTHSQPQNKPNRRSWRTSPTWRILRSSIFVIARRATLEKGLEKERRRRFVFGSSSIVRCSFDEKFSIWDESMPFLGLLEK